MTTASGASPTRPPLGITALGAYAPARVISNADFEARLETNAEWIESRTGIRERRFAAEDEFTSDVGVGAVRDLLARDPEVRRHAVRQAPLIHASDTISAWAAGQSGALPPKAAKMTTAISAVNLALALIASRNSRRQEPK